MLVVGPAELVLEYSLGPRVNLHIVADLAAIPSAYPAGGPLNIVRVVSVGLYITFK